MALSKFNQFETNENIIKKFNEFRSFIIKHPKKFKLGNRSLFCISIYELMEFKECIKHSGLNRQLDIKRINNIRFNFNSKLSDPIILALRNDLKIFKILDGQHRLNAIFMSDGKYDCDEIILDIRDIRTKDEFNKHLQIINDRYEFSSEQYSLKDKLKLIYTHLQEYFIETCKPFFKSNRPFINWKYFSRKLKENNFFKNKDNSHELIIKQLIKINNFLMNLELIYIHPDGTIKDGVFTDKMYEKGCKIGHILGIDTRYRYLQLLNVPEENWDDYWMETICGKS